MPLTSACVLRDTEKLTTPPFEATLQMMLCSAILYTGVKCMTKQHQFFSTFVKQPERLLAHSKLCTSDAQDPY
jgi:hypothetical protein